MPGTRIAFCDHWISLSKYKNIHGNSKFDFLSENLYTHVTGFVMMRNNFLYDLATDTMNGLISGGIIQHYFDNFEFFAENFFKIALSPKQEEHDTMKFSDLSYGFTLWILACLICYVVFLLELTSFYIKMDPIYHFRNFIGLLGLLNALLVFNKCYCGDLRINMKQSNAISNQTGLAWKNQNAKIKIYRFKKYMTRISKVFLK